MKTLIIRNGTLLLPEGECIADIHITGNTIHSIGKPDPDALQHALTVDAMGKLVFPGGIDPHVHLALPTPAGPSCDDFISGSNAALAGGTTCLFDFVTPKRDQPLMEALQQRRDEASASLIETGLHLGISGWNNHSEKDVIACIEKENVHSFKAYLAYRETIGISRDELKLLMEIASSYDRIVLVHSEDGDMISNLKQEFVSLGKIRPGYHALARPPEAEVRAIDTVLELSAKTGCRVYIVHVSTGKGAELIRQAKKTGVRVNAETCIQYLLLDDSVYDLSRPDREVLPYVLSPPIRGKADQEMLWDGLANGTFDTVATDHCPFNSYGQKDKGLDDFTKIPNGAGGIEHRLTLLYSYGVLKKRITLQQFVGLTSTNAAAIFGLGNRKGKLQEGYEADLVIWDPEATSVISAGAHLSKCDTDLYEGFGITGKPESVIVGGNIVNF